MLLGTIWQGMSAWRKLAAIPLKPSVAYKILKYVKCVSAEYGIAEKQHVALIHEITGTKDGQDAKIEPGTSEHREYAGRFNETLSIEVPLAGIDLNLADVVGLLDGKPDSLSVSDLLLLEPFFSDYVEPENFRNDDGTPKTELDGE